MSAPETSSVTQRALDFQAVHARDDAGLRGRARGALRSVTCSFGAGIHALIGTPRDGTLAFIDVAVGRRRPKNGRVTLSGRDPHRDPALRRGIGFLSSVVELPPLRRAGDVLRFASDRRTALLDDLGLAGLSSRSVESLSYGEARAFELALALSVPRPALLVLYEPFSDVASIDLIVVRRRLREMAAGGCAVIIVVSSAATVAGLVDGWLRLEHGVIAAGSGRSLAQGQLDLWVECDDESARTFASALNAHQEFDSVSWVRESPELYFYRLRGTDLERVSRRAAETCTQCGVTLRSMAAGVPQRESLRAQLSHGGSV